MTAMRSSEKLEPEITFRNMEPSDAIEARIAEKVVWLTKRHDRLTHVRVTVEVPHRNHHKGVIFHVKIVLGVPGKPDLVINHEPEADHAHEDVYVAIRDAFDAARRRLDDADDTRTGRSKVQRA